jgi:hypothetical protein
MTGRGIDPAPAAQPPSLPPHHLPAPLPPCLPPRRYQELRQQRLQEALGRQQYEELRECTFTPAINSEPPAAAAAAAAAGPVLVRGLHRHLELKALAQQRQQAQKELEDRLFMAQPKVGGAGGGPALPLRCAASTRWPGGVAVTLWHAETHEAWS